jgi:hypothetical protein
VSEEDSKAINSESAPKNRTDRDSYVENVKTSLNLMLTAASTEGAKLRWSDYVAVSLLPISSILLLLVSVMSESLTIRPLLVILTMLCVLYYIGSRMGVVKTLTSRQSYLILQMCIACFIFGCVFALFIIDSRDFVFQTIQKGF